jgi:hypothetical protein
MIIYGRLVTNLAFSNQSIVYFYTSQLRRLVFSLQPQPMFCKKIALVNSAIISLQS